MLGGGAGGVAKEKRMQRPVQEWRRIAALVLGFTLVMGCGLASCDVNQPVSQGELSVCFLDVEQGNGILIVSPTGIAALIDAGTGRGDGHSDTDPVQFIRTLAGSVADFRLQVVIATHYDADHIGKLDEVLNAGLLSASGTVYDHGGPGTDSGAYTKYAASIGSHEHVAAAPGMTIDLGGGAALRCYAAGGAYWDGAGVQTVSLSPTDENGRSVALVLTYRQFKMWFGGDLGETVEEVLAPYLPDVDVYAVDHHGSQSSSSLSFLEALKPEHAICQSGEDNTYGHPNKDAVSRILSISTTDGGHPKFIQQNRGKPGDSNSDDSLAFVIADPDGSGSLPGTITVTTDGRTSLCVKTPVTTLTTALGRYGGP